MIRREIRRELTTFRGVLHSCHRIALCLACLDTQSNCHSTRDSSLGCESSAIGSLSASVSLSHEFAAASCSGRVHPRVTSVEPKSQCTRTRGRTCWGILPIPKDCKPTWTAAYLSRISSTSHRAICRRCYGAAARNGVTTICS